MSERVINISFPVKESILLSLKEDKHEFAKELLFLGALVLYRKKKLSLGKAAELAGYNKLDFIGKLQAEGEPIFDYSNDEVEEIFEDAKK